MEYHFDTNKSVITLIKIKMFKGKICFCYLITLCYSTVRNFLIFAVEKVCRQIKSIFFIFTNFLKGKQIASAFIQPQVACVPKVAWPCARVTMYYEQEKPLT